MSAMTASAATIPFQSSQRCRRPWQPSDRDHLIFRWVKFEGQTQGWVAQQFNIDQSTVSRIIQRYERWQAHAQPGEAGRLAHAERLRAQRWLTYERNELMLAACLRIAGDMEGFTDVSKSTVCHQASQPSKELEVRTQHARIDRSGIAARFLRLGFRINMEQLKLVELDPLPPLPPLSPDDFDDLDADIQDRSLTPSATSDTDGADLAAEAPQNEAPQQGSTLAEPLTCPEPTGQSSSDSHTEPTPTEPSTPPSGDEPTTTCHSPTHYSPSSVHKMHNGIDTEAALTPDRLCRCASDCDAQKSSDDAYDPDLQDTPCPPPPNPRLITTSSLPCSCPT
jgi:hypothetical protein